MTAPDALQHVADASRHSAARIESLSLELANLRARMENLETRLDGTNAAFLASGDRIEALRVELKTFSRLEAGLSQLQAEVTRDNEARTRTSEKDLAAVQARLRSEAERLARETGLLAGRIEQLEQLPGRLDAAERERAEIYRTLAALDARADGLTEDRAAFQEDLRRIEQRQLARQEELHAQLRDLETELATWRGRIEQQSESVREARSVADHMHEVAAGMRQEHHATAEAERVFEARVDGLLTAMRRDVTEEWQRFRNERAADWALLTQGNAARDASNAALGVALEDAVTRLTALEAGLKAGLLGQTDALAALRRDLATALGQWRQSQADANTNLEAAISQTESPAALEERRQTLRNTLRDQRAARES